MTFVGYARIGMGDAGTAAQSEVLARSGCKRIFEEPNGPEKHFARPAPAKALAYLRGGDVLVVCRRDRPGWSLSALVETITDLASQGIGVRSIDGSVDTTGPDGALVLQTLHALAISSAR